MDWSGVDYCDVLSAVLSLILTAPIHCWASIAEQVNGTLHFSKSVLRKKQMHLNLGWVHIQKILGWNILLIRVLTIKGVLCVTYLFDLGFYFMISI